MAPQDLTELKAIIEMVNAPMQRSLDRSLTGQDELRRMIDHFMENLAKQEERVRAVEKDVADLYKKLDDIEKTILDHQQRKFKQTIAMQGTIILLVLGAFISYVVPLLFHR